jgi:transcriptional regulator GlxA family with amidase domain
MDVFVRAVGSNEKKITELFRRQFGLTVYEYLVSLRLEEARCKLAGSELQIQAIAEQAGYRNASDFSRAFRLRYGLGPRQYRQSTTSVTPG